LTAAPVRQYDAHIAGAPETRRVDTFIRGADDLADLHVVVQERHELRPGVAPQPADRRVGLAPLLLELGEPGQRFGLRRSGIDRPQVVGDLVPVLPRREPERVADQVDDAGLYHGQLPHGGDGVGESLEAVADRDADVWDTAVLQLGQHLQPELGAFAAVAGPQPENVAFPAHRDSDHDIDRLVADLPVADLDHDRVDEDHRIHRVQRPVGPLDHLLDHLVGDLGDRFLAHRGAVDLGEVRRDLPRRQPPRRQGEDDLIDPGQPALPLPHDLRGEARIGVSRHVDLDRADLSQHRLRANPVARVPTVPTHRIMLVIAQMLRHLLFERCLQHPLGQLVQQPVRADQLDTLVPSLGQELLGQLLLVQLLLIRCCHISQRVSHGLSPLGSDQPVPPFS